MLFLLSHHLRVQLNEIKVAARSGVIVTSQLLVKFETLVHDVLVNPNTDLGDLTLQLLE